MMQKTIIYSVVVLLVIGVLVFITINGREDTLPEQSENMQKQGQGVGIEVQKEGTGEAAKAGDMISVNYTGTFEDGTAFDSNVDPKFGHVEPFTFTLGIGQVVRGWDEGVAGMKVGEKRKLTIAPEYGYGAAGAGGVIPPNATLIFEVELLAIEG